MATALVHVETLTAVELFKPGTIDPILERIRAEVKLQAADLDISTETGRKEIASLAYKVARSKTFVDNQRKALVTEEKRRLAVIDAEGKRIWNELEALQTEVRKPLTEWEDVEKTRIATIEAILAEMEGAGAYTLQNWQNLPLEAMQDRLAEIERETRDWQEFERRAALAKSTAIAAIKTAIVQREKYENERAELERLRTEAAERARIEREANIAREATERAEAEAKRQEQVNREKVDAEFRRIEQEREQAIAQAKAAEERSARAIENERQRVAAEEKKLRDEKEAREKDKTHRAKVNREAKAALIKHLSEAPFCVNDVAAQKIVELIVKGLIPNVTIQY